jgi:hypothetical protein
MGPFIQFSPLNLYHVLMLDLMRSTNHAALHYAGFSVLSRPITVEFGYDVMKGTECFVSL